jgi:hypothetical protein
MFENDCFLYSHLKMAVHPDSKLEVRQVPQAHDMSLIHLPVDVWSCHLASIQSVVSCIVLYFDGRHMGLNIYKYCINYYVQTCCHRGQRVLN